MTFRDRITAGDVLIGDGAVGTILQGKGLPIGTAPETWTLERPDIVKEVAASYFQAGSDFVLTNTFGGNRVRLGKAGLSDQVARINAEGVALAKLGARGNGYVLASIGPTGEALPESDYRQIYSEQVSAFVAADVDGFCVETVCSSVEGFSAVRAVRELSDLPIILSFVLKETDSGLATLAEETFEDVAPRVKDEGADVLGVNCIGWDLVAEAVEAIGRVSDLSLAVSPNAGVPTESNGIRYPEQERDLAQKLAELVLPGVSVCGGCCGTGTAYIESLRESEGGSERHR
jgi:5-methyltetrahydrofolate--homocysteine methyltransferase